MQVCAGCDRPIFDRFLLNVLDRAWHVRCVQCSDCNMTLNEKCFSRDGKLYCRNDFFTRFGTKCAGCLQGISPSDLVRRARNKVFHLKCFTCMICRKELSTGEELYILDENKFICKEDYLASKLTGSDVEDDGDFENVLDQSGNDVEYGTQDEIQSNEQDLFLPSSDRHSINGQLNDINSINMHNSDTTNLIPGSNTGLNLSISKISTDSKSESNSLSDSHINSDNFCFKEENRDHLSDSCLSPAGQDSQIPDHNPGSNCSSLDNNDSNNNKDGIGNEKAGNKRRGPRTTIKAKQLEILKASFNATPKPTRHIREQLAAETGLNMRVIQVWFQNRRSKERRMKQLSALGARRHFFRGPRRMRGLRGDLDDGDLLGQGYGYFNENGQDFYPGYPGPGFGDFFPGQGPDMPPGMPMMPHQGRGTPPMSMEHPMHPAGPIPHEAQYLPPQDMIGTGSPEPLMNPEDQYLMTSLPPRSLSHQYPHPGDNWG